MKSLAITNKNKEVVAYAQVDDDLFPYLSKVRWHNDGKGYPKTGFRRDDGTVAHVYLHQIVFRCKYKRDPSPGKQIDHIDRNKLNAQRSNLRELTHSFNQANRNKQSNNSSGYIGVSWYKKLQKWNAQIGVNNKNIHLGLYSCPHEAARAVNRAYEKYFPGLPTPNPQADLLPVSFPQCTFALTQ